MMHRYRILNYLNTWTGYLMNFDYMMELLGNFTPNGLQHLLVCLGDCPKQPFLGSNLVLRVGVSTG